MFEKKSRDKFVVYYIRSRMFFFSSLNGDVAIHLKGEKIRKYWKLSLVKEIKSCLELEKCPNLFLV